MICAKCGKKAKVYASLKKNNTAYRQYKCMACDNEFYTKAAETECNKQDFLRVQRMRCNNAYYRKCMRKWKEEGAES